MARLLEAIGGLVGRNLKNLKRMEEFGGANLGTIALELKDFYLKSKMVLYLKLFGFGKMLEAQEIPSKN
jgi:hypothetical protein